MRVLLAGSVLVAACTRAGVDEPAAETPVIAAPVSPNRSAPPAPPRLLHPHVRGYGVRDGGDLLVNLLDDDGITYEGVHVLDPSTGKTTPWTAPWRPDARWKVASGGDRPRDLVVSPDGRWVALQIFFAGRRQRDEYYAIVAARTDASEARCVGVAPFWQYPHFTFTPDSARLLGQWTIACEPDARGRPIDTTRDRWSHDPWRWFDLRDGSHGDLPKHLQRGRILSEDPLGDTVLVDADEPAPAHEPQSPPAVRFLELSTGADRGGASLPGPLRSVLAWVEADAVYVSHERPGEPDGRAVVFADGRVVIDESARLTIYTRLPGGEVLYSEDEGATVEQGRIDWRVPRIVSSIPRRDLGSHRTGGIHDIPGPRGPRWRVWRPALGGVMIETRPEGPLELAGL